MTKIEQTTNERALRVKLNQYLKAHQDAQVKEHSINLRRVVLTCGCVLDWNEYYQVYSTNLSGCKIHNLPEGFMSDE